MHERISLLCAVRAVTDESQLHYEAEIRDVDPESRRLLTAFLSTRNRLGVA